MKLARGYEPRVRLMRYLGQRVKITTYIQRVSKDEKYLVLGHVWLAKEKVAVCDHMWINIENEPGLVAGKFHLRNKLSFTAIVTVYRKRNFTFQYGLRDIKNVIFDSG